MEALARPAATIMLLRDGPEGIEVFMVVRHQAIAFAGGALVFPGGRVEEADHEFAASSADCPNPEGLDTGALAFRIAAIRETFEECGVLFARPRGSEELIDAATLKRLEDQHRAALNAGSIGFDAVLESEGLVPAPDMLVHFAHWITPASQPKRYDTQFFLADAPAAHLAVHDGWEAVESLWITPARALADTDAGIYKLVFATAKNLEKLGRSRTVREAIEAARASTVVTVQPKGTKLESGKRLMRIPEEAGYGGTEFIVDYMPASG
ncbi:MAG TPA: NUDIX hydrolase [Acetobacteraceae bacterium]|jgi:8-oxo-dGTP pyrophosphatase MutT (NUDIX family)|nr:NUDIX hydrolase [Acetobacteraceae bacterium]